ncbi:RHO GTPase-activating protein [Yarrowia sp. C11]|nr:RHO GTPase-activating protein [Yarrowia sp. E02]KAG5367255.1 RHO GTPase-activating protein [Yarrowia sp. C11]
MPESRLDPKNQDDLASKTSMILDEHKDVSASADTPTSTKHQSLAGYSDSDNDGDSIVSTSSVGDMEEHGLTPAMSRMSVEDTSTNHSGSVSGPSSSAGGALSSSVGTTLNASNFNVAPQKSTHLLEDPKLQEIMLSDVGISSLLARSKQSIVSCKEFAQFIKKRGALELDHITHLKKLSRNTRDAIKRPEHRQGTFYRQFDEIARVGERVSDVSATFVTKLNAMNDELSELARTTEKTRKQVKETHLRHEKNLVDLEQAAEKAKAKYESLYDDLERARTGDPTKNKFGFKTTKNSVQHEEELQRKVQAADQDYQQKVSAAQRARQELLRVRRPEASRDLKDLIFECDSGMSLQFQKFANVCETLALNNGFVVSPLKPPGTSTNVRSMRENAALIDNEKDFFDSVMAVPRKQRLNRDVVQYKSRAGPKSSFNYSSGSGSASAGAASKPVKGPTPFASSSPSPFSSSNPSSAGLGQRNVSSGTTSSALPPAASSSMINPTPSGAAGTIGGIAASRVASTSSTAAPAIQPTISMDQQSVTSSVVPTQFPPGVTDSMPVYGTPIEDLLDYEGGTVPRAVYQCVQAIDNFGLEVEGIYRANGNNSQIQEIKHLFDTDPSKVDLLHPSDNLNDIHSVASALKLYFRELPDCLLTKELHQEFIDGAMIENAIQRRDALHGTVNKLPDANYTTLRYLIFHLYRIQEREAINRMSVVNLGIVWGPTLMNTDYGNVAEMGFQGRVIETILVNAYVIFDAE